MIFILQTAYTSLPMLPLAEVIYSADTTRHILTTAQSTLTDVGDHWRQLGNIEALYQLKELMTRKEEADAAKRVYTKYEPRDEEDLQGMHIEFRSAKCIQNPYFTADCPLWVDQKCHLHL